MKHKLDVKDRKILYQLDHNSRQPLSDIARAVGLSKQVVGFRLKRLLDEHILLSCYTVIDISKLGFTVHKNFLKLQNLDKDKEQEIIEFLKLHPNVVWVASCDGAFDLAFGTWAKDMAFLDKTLAELSKKFGDCIAERQIATIIHGEYFTREYLVEKKHTGDLRQSFFGAVPSPAAIDEHDWIILMAVSTNARMTAVELAGKTGLSADAIGVRIRKLEKSGVIKHYTIVPNESAYPYLHYKVLVNFRNPSPEKESALLEYCRMHRNIVYVVKALGPWSFEIDIEVESIEEFREVLMDIKTRCNELIKEYSSLHIYQVHKYNFCPSKPA